MTDPVIFAYNILLSAILYDGPGGSQTSPVLFFAVQFYFSQSSFIFSRPVLFFHSPVLLFHSPVLFFHSPVLILI